MLISDLRFTKYFRQNLVKAANSFLTYA